MSLDGSLLPPGLTSGDGTEFLTGGSGGVGGVPPPLAGGGEPVSDTGGGATGGPDDSVIADSEPGDDGSDLPPEDTDGDGHDDTDLIDEPIDEEPPDDPIQPGTLTAGSFDDNLNFDVFLEFLSELVQDDAGGQLPAINLGQRIIITVTNDAGQPIGDARVVVTDAGAQDQQAQPVLSKNTGSDGRTLFLTGIDGPAVGPDFTVTVHPPDGSPPVSQSAGLDTPEWNITLPAVAAILPTQLDLAFVVDATGSMSDELEYLKVEMDHIAQTVSADFPDVTQRYALIVYRDQGDEYVTRAFDFTGSLSQFQADLAAQVASGGGDYPEAMHTALQDAGALTWADTDTARVLFLVADAPPHVQFGQQTLDAAAALRSLGVAIYPVAASGVADEAEFFMRTAAFWTLSQYLFLTDDSAVGLAHAEPHIPCYQVQPLSDLMIQMIASQLGGEPVYPAPENVIRTVGNPVNGVCMEGQQDFEPDDDFDQQ